MRRLTLSLLLLSLRVGAEVNETYRPSLVSQVRRTCHQVLVNANPLTEYRCWIQHQRRAHNALIVRLERRRAVEGRLQHAHPRERELRLRAAAQNLELLMLGANREVFVRGEGKVFVRWGSIILYDPATLLVHDIVDRDARL